MTHDRAIEIARILVAAGYRVDLTLEPARPPSVAMLGSSPEAATVRVPLHLIGRPVTLADVIELEHVLAAAGARGEFGGEFIRVVG